MAGIEGGAATLLRDAAERLARAVARAVDDVEALAQAQPPNPEKLARAAGVVARAGVAVLALEQRLLKASTPEDTAEWTEADVDDDEPRGEAPDAAPDDAHAGAVREAAIQRGLRQLERLFAGGERGGAEGAGHSAAARAAGHLDLPGGPRPAPA